MAILQENLMSQDQLRFSVHECVRHWSRYHPKQPAIVEEAGKSLTYLELQHRILDARQILRGYKLSPKSIVAVVTRQPSQFLTWLCAIHSEGLSIAVINPLLAPRTIADMVADNGANLVLSGAPSATSEVNVDVHDGSLPAIRVSRFTDSPPLARGVSDTWGIIYSSGSTGTPKGIVRTDLSVVTELIGWCLELPITRGSCTYIGRPVYYTGGLVLSLATLMVGGCVIAPETHTADTWLEKMKAHEVATAFLLPVQVQELLDARQATSGYRPAPRRILTMGAPITSDLKRRVLNELRCDYIESWGNSEGLGTITDPQDVWLRPDSIGRPFMTDEMFILDDDGHKAPIGATGRICGVADSSFKEYMNLDELNEQMIRESVVVSEDLGRVDEDGYFYILGRTSDLILRSGMPLYAADLEREIRKDPDVAGAAVVGLPCTREGAVPGALVVLGDGVALDELGLLQRLNERSEAPRRLQRLRIVDRIPTNAAGKVDLVAVKALLDGATDADSLRAASRKHRAPEGMRSVLLVIDPQRAYTDPDSDLYCPDAAETVSRINRLIRHCEAQGNEIIYFRHIHDPDGSDWGRMFDYAGQAEEARFLEGTQEVEWALDLYLSPARSERRKSRYSCFARTDLHEYLSARGVERLVICGFMTNCCCASTARSAHDLDYFVEFVLDATGTPGAGDLQQDEIRRTTGAMLAEGFAMVLSATEYLGDREAA